MKDFFISYNKADRSWAEWIAWQLKEAGYEVVIQAWDFRPGSNFVLEMDKAARGTERTIAVLSEDYMKAEFTHPEWAAAFAKDPRGEQRALVPVLVRKCETEGLLNPIVQIRLVNLEEQAAREALLAG
ncbi:MAG TPA: toll/interleukin-1 receptor domain-containing protein, partial [Chloroflexia bacterium]|nr:toll/interleukin-1 receptor domain-containing protein [Chloroflexia bacterium]